MLKMWQICPYVAYSTLLDLLFGIFKVQLEGYKPHYSVWNKELFNLLQM